jgi:chromosome segregation ATPase
MQMVPSEYEIHLLRNQLSEKDRLLKTQEKKTQNLSNQVHLLTKDNQNKNKQITSLKKTNSELQAKVKSRNQNQISSYEREIHQLKNQLSRKDQELLTQAKRTQESATQVNTLTKEINKKNGQIQGLMNDNSRLQTQFKYKENQFDQENIKKTGLDAQVIRLMNDLKNKRDKLESQVQLNSSLKLKLHDFEEINKQLRTQNILLKKKITEMIRKEKSANQKSKAESIIKKTLLLNTVGSPGRFNNFDSSIAKSDVDYSQSFLGSERHLSISKLDLKEQNRKLKNKIDYLKKENYRLFAQKQRLEPSIEAIKYW